MKTSFKVCLCMIIALFITSLSAEEMKKKDKPAVWKYDIECAGTGSDGSYLVKVWTYWKNRQAPTNVMKMNAVHGVLFRGFSGGQGCKAQKPIIKEPATYEAKLDFFNTFFGESNAYSKYVSIVSPAPEVIKMNKKEYKIGVVISVSKDMLRKDMEDAGIIKSLTSIF